MLLATYLIDTCFFVTSFQRTQRSSACLRSMMKVHHMATILLLAVSWSHNFQFYGCFVLFIHDVSDVPMFAVRLLRDSAAPHAKAKQLFVVPVLLFTWIYYRVGWLGALICQTAVMTANGAPDDPSWLYKALCGVFLFVLWTFNVYWTSLVVKKVLVSLAREDWTKDDDNE